jgi:hypothetical protein
LHSQFKYIFLPVLMSGFLIELYGQDDTVTMKIADSLVKDRIDIPIAIPDTFEIGEAVILPYKTYADFKRAFVNMGESPAANETAKKNMIIVQDQILKGISPEMNSYENYRNRYTYNLLRPEGIIIISTNPHQGVVPLIKKALGKD